jgi:hypothetical protein
MPQKATPNDRKSSSGSASPARSFQKVTQCGFLNITKVEFVEARDDDEFSNYHSLFFVPDFVPFDLEGWWGTRLYQNLTQTA